MPVHSYSTKPGMNPKHAETDPLYLAFMLAITLINAGIGAYMIWVGIEKWEDCDFDVPMYLVIGGVAASAISFVKVLSVVVILVNKGSPRCQVIEKSYVTSFIACSYHVFTDLVDGGSPIRMRIGRAGAFDLGNYRRARKLFSMDG